VFFGGGGAASELTVVAQRISRTPQVAASAPAYDVRNGS
jgi:hypothetical protein